VYEHGLAIHELYCTCLSITLNTRIPAIPYTLNHTSDVSIVNKKFPKCYNWNPIYKESWNACIESC